MFNASLQLFCNRIVEAGRLTEEDLAVLRRDVMPYGLASRDEADLLIALDRAVSEMAPAFADFLVAEMVDFAVWGERPTGYIDEGTAAWLAGSIGGGSGPTRTGARIAMEVVREAQASDETLIAFALEANRWTRDPKRAERPRLLLAA